MTPLSRAVQFFVEVIAKKNEPKPRTRQHEQIVSNKGRTAWIMELEKMLGASCIVPPVPGRTTDLSLIHI